MPVNSQDLITSVNGVHAAARCEADWRGVCSRAYYSIYQDALEFHDQLPSPGNLTPDSDGGLHADLIDRLIHPTVKRTDPNYLRSMSIGTMMKTVYANRIKSDYKREKSVDRAAANSSIELISRISEKLIASASSSLHSQNEGKATSAPCTNTEPSTPKQSTGRPTITRIK